VSNSYHDTLHALREAQEALQGRASVSIEARLIADGHIIQPLYEINDDAEAEA
jgi:hypothetical protein